MSKMDILKHELIGVKVKVVDASNKALIGINGKIMDETRNMLTIEYNGNLKRLIKSQVILQLDYRGKEYKMNGKLLMNRPEDRIKKVRGLLI